MDVEQEQTPENQLDRGPHSKRINTLSSTQVARSEVRFKCFDFALSKGEGWYITDNLHDDNTRIHLLYKQLEQHRVMKEC